MPSMYIKLINLKGSDSIAAVAKVMKEEAEGGEEEDTTEEPTSEETPNTENTENDTQTEE